MIGIEINSEMHTDDHSSRMIAIGVRYEVMGGNVQGNIYKLMADENGVTVWVNDEPSHSFGYDDINGWVIGHNSIWCIIVLVTLMLEETMNS